MVKIYFFTISFDNDFNNSSILCVSSLKLSISSIEIFSFSKDALALLILPNSSSLKSCLCIFSQLTPDSIANIFLANVVALSLFEKYKTLVLFFAAFKARFNANEVFPFAIVPKIVITLFALRTFNLSFKQSKP